MDTKRCRSARAALAAGAMTLLHGCGGGGDGDQGAVPLMDAYPAEWNVPFTPSAAIPASYEFGRKTITYAKGQTFAPAAMPLPCDIVHERDLPVTLRDGTVIYTDVLRQAGQEGRLPAIVSWSPYGKTIPNPPPDNVPPEWFSGLAKFEGADAAVFACRGYAVINPDARGAFKSGGSFHWWGSVEGSDGHDLIEWVAQQDWSNGKVATYGSSWLAISQWFIASTKPPHLAAIVPWNGFSDVGRDHILWGGIPNVTMASGFAINMTGGQQNERIDLAGTQSQTWSPYWEDKRAKLEDVTVPAYVVADGLPILSPRGSMDGFRRLGSSEKWLRLNDSQEWYDQYNPVHTEDVLKFLDHYLKGTANGWTSTPRVRVDVMDIGRSSTAETYSQWPPAEARNTKFYLDASAGSLNATAAGTSSSTSYDAVTGETTFTVKFNADTKVIGYSTARLFVEADGSDDMDVYVLVEKLDAAGNPVAPIPGCRADYVQKCLDAVGPTEPPGAPGRVRASHRELDASLSTEFDPVLSLKNPRKLKAGEVVPIDISIYPRAYQYRAGEQLRLTVGGYHLKSTNQLPSVNAGRHIIHTGGQSASYLQVPIVPN